VTIFRFTAVAVFFFTLIFGISHASNETMIEAKIHLTSKLDLIQVRELSLDISYMGADYITIVTNQKEIEELESLGLKVEVIHPDLKSFYRSRLTNKDMGGYKTLDEIYAYMDTIISENPNIVSAKESIGQTIEGRDIWAFKISDNPEIDEDEPEVLYTAAIHCREVITPEVLFFFIDHLVDNYGTDPEVTDLVDNRELWFILLINPDGYNYNQLTDPNGGGMWRKNRRDNGDGYFGVDLNRNFGYEWGYDNSGSSPSTWSETYRGTGPFSEPETQALRDFHNAHDFIITLYYHSHSNIIIYPWGYETLFTPDHDIFTAMSDSISVMNSYEPGTAWMLLYPVNGSSDDWSYGEQSSKNKSFAITIEVGNESDGFWPPTSRIPELVSENLGPNLFLADLADHIYQLKPPGIPFLTAADTVNALDYEIQWTHDDTLNPAVSYELAEMQNYQQNLTDSADDFSRWDNNQFELSLDRSHSYPSSFYSGEGDDFYRYMTIHNPIHVELGDSLKFWTYYDIETDWDYAYVEVSLNGESYTPIEGNITTDTDPNGNNRGNGITGSSLDWVEASFDLSNYAGRNIYIRFTYETDSYVTEEGFYVDDIYPVDGYAIENIISSSITDTSYNFTDKSEGTYYYKVRARDAEDQWGKFSIIRQTEAVSMFICGDANGDESINVLDITYLINYLYKDGPGPDPEYSADVNNSGAVNILDISYLIKYIYQEGPQPDCP